MDPDFPFHMGRGGPPVGGFPPKFPLPGYGPFMGRGGPPGPFMGPGPGGYFPRESYGPLMGRGGPPVGEHFWSDGGKGKKRKRIKKLQSGAMEGEGKREPVPKKKKTDAQETCYLIDRIVSSIKRPKNPKAFRNSLTLSKWLLEIPQDFEENWIVVPCPPGKRMLVVAGKSITRCFAKSGDVIYTFYSELPGGHPLRGDECLKSLTILDCIWHHRSKSYYVLDVLYWNTVSFLESEAGFRFTWLEQKMSEIPGLSEVTSNNEFCFQYLPRHSCTRYCLSEVMSSDPLVFNDLTVIVDGFLFYDLDASYVSGNSSAVGWLKPFMVPDVLKIEVCSELLVDKPSNYAGIQQFIEEFKKEKKKVIRRERKMRNQKFMHVEETKEEGRKEEKVEEEKDEDKTLEVIRTGEIEQKD